MKNKKADNIIQNNVQYYNKKILKKFDIPISLMIIHNLI